MSKIIHWLILPCSEVTCEIEKQKAGKSSFIRRVQIVFHLSVCKVCNVYNKQVMMLDATMQKIIKKEKKSQLKNFDEQEFKERLKEKFKK